MQSVRNAKIQSQNDCFSACAYHNDNTQICAGTDLPHQLNEPSERRCMICFFETCYCACPFRSPSTPELRLQTRGQLTTYKWTIYD